MSAGVSPDQVCREAAGKGVALSVRLLEDVVLIEGDQATLEFLGRLLLAQAAFSDDGFEVSPRGPGSALFSSESPLGIYIHRLDDTERALRASD